MPVTISNGIAPSVRSSGSLNITKLIIIFGGGDQQIRKTFKNCGTPPEAPGWTQPPRCSLCCCKFLVRPWSTPPKLPSALLSCLQFLSDRITFPTWASEPGSVWALQLRAFQRAHMTTWQGAAVPGKSINNPGLFPQTLANSLKWQVKTLGPNSQGG